MPPQCPFLTTYELTTLNKGKGELEVRRQGGLWHDEARVCHLTSTLSKLQDPLVLLLISFPFRPYTSTILDLQFAVGASGKQNNTKCKVNKQAYITYCLLEIVSTTHIILARLKTSKAIKLNNRLSNLFNVSIPYRSYVDLARKLNQPVSRHALFCAPIYRLPFALTYSNKRYQKLVH